MTAVTLDIALDVLARLETAAQRRETPMGDPSDLFSAKAELAAAAKAARDLLAGARPIATTRTPGAEA